MADLFGKKPKPEQGLGSEQKPKLSQNSNGLNGAKVQPGSPDKMDHVPVGINKRRFESDKHADKRLNKMFKETNQPTLGVWNHDKKNNPTAKPDKVKFNPDLEYKPTKEQIDQAKLNRQKIINQGFAPAEFNKNSAEDSFYAGSPKGYREASQRIKDWGNKNKIQVDEKSTTGYYDEDPDFWAINDYEVFPGENGSYKIHKDGKEIGSASNDDELFNYVKGQNQEQKNSNVDADVLSKKQKLWDRYNGLNDDQKKDFALNVYRYGTDSHDNPLGKFKDPYTGEIMYADAENNYEDRSDYLLANDEDSRAQLEEAVNNLDIDNMSDEEIEKLFSEHDTEDLEPWDEEEENSEPQQPQVNTEQTRKILRSMGYKDDQIDMIFNNIPETYRKN